jgi:hyperosmotically inducible protein
MKLSAITTVAILAVTPMLATTAATASSAATLGQTSDEQLASLIATKIANDKSLSPDAIKVKVEGGVVTLSGMVGKDADKVRAEEMARVPGVTRVENKLASREKATDKAKEVSKKGAEKTKDAVSKTGEVITDTWISSRIKTKFMGDEALRASDIKVDSDRHVVTLSGAVPNAAAHAKAIAMAREVEGVKRVVDKLQNAAKTP